MSHNLTDYKNKVSIRKGAVDGLEEWNWITKDSGAFDGPLSDWIESHREAYTKYIRGRKVVVQAGGNCGLYPMLFSQIFEQVYCFEPDPLNFYTLVNNCQDDFIIKIQAALGDCHKMVGIIKGPEYNVGMHKIAPEGIVPQLCIDDFDWPVCDLIQLDVERYEINALRGGVKTIEKFHPVISVENVSKEIEEFLGQFGYKAAQTSKMDTILVSNL